MKEEQRMIYMKLKVGVCMIMSAFIIMLASCANEIEDPELTSFRSVEPEEALQRLESSEDIIMVDVRTPVEYAEERIPGSLLIPLQTLEEEAPQHLTDKETPVFIYCRSGRRSLEAAEILVELRYTNVYDLGGIIDWSYDVEKQHAFGSVL